MDRYESQVGGRPIVYTAEGIQYGNVPVPFDRMTDIEIIKGPTPSWQFTFNGRRMQVPYTEGERAYVEPFVQGAIQAKGMDDLMAAFEVPAEQAVPQPQQPPLSEQGQLGDPAFPIPSPRQNPAPGLNGETVPLVIADPTPSGGGQDPAQGGGAQPQTENGPGYGYGVPQDDGLVRIQGESLEMPGSGDGWTYNRGAGTEQSQGFQDPGGFGGSGSFNGSGPDAGGNYRAGGGGTACKVCGMEIPAGVKRCPRCGEKIRKPIYKRPWFIAAAAVLLLIILGGVFAGGNDEDLTAEEKAITTESTTQEETTSETAATETTTTEEATTEEATTKKENSGSDKEMTAAQRNAYQAAQNYLDFMAFSRAGLIDQLTSEYGDGYDQADAEFAVNKLEEDGDVDWNKQAEKAAQNYLNSMTFSRDGLIQQLESEYGDQFTHDQAVHGVDAVYDSQ